MDHKFVQVGQPLVGPHYCWVYCQSEIEGSIFSFYVLTHCVIATFFGLILKFYRASVYLLSLLSDWKISFKNPKRSK